MRRFIEFLYRRFCKPDILAILKEDLNLADYEVKASKMDENEYLEYLSSSYRIVEEPSFKENIQRAINAQADLTFRGSGNLHDSTVAIAAIRSLQVIFENQARTLESLTKKKPTDPYEVG